MEVQLRDVLPYLTSSPNPTLSTAPSTVVNESFDVEDARPRTSRKNQTITIEHRTVGNSRNFMLGLSKPVFGVLTALLVASTTGGCAYFFSQWMQIPGLQSQLEELQVQNDRFAQLNAELNETNQRLTAQVKRLTTENDRFVQLNGDLQESNARLTETTSELKREVQDLTSLNNRLVKLNADLTSVVSFLNETAMEIDESMESVLSYVSEQIETNRHLVLESLHNIYLQRIATWDCDFRDYFKNHDFVIDENHSIGSSSVSAILDYVNERVLTELCLDTQDFERYVSTEFRQKSIANISARQLVSGVQRYTAMAMDYYFPDVDDIAGGLTALDWADASYSCERLTSDQQFSATGNG